MRKRETRISRGEAWDEPALRTGSDTFGEAFEEAFGGDWEDKYDWIGAWADHSLHGHLRREDEDCDADDIAFRLEHRGRMLDFLWSSDDGVISRSKA